jgi:hypothetical protein
MKGTVKISIDDYEKLKSKSELFDQLKTSVKRSVSEVNVYTELEDGSQSITQGIDMIEESGIIDLVLNVFYKNHERIFQEE